MLIATLADESKTPDWTEHWSTKLGGHIIVLCAYCGSLYWIGRSQEISTGVGHILSTTVEEPKALDSAQEQVHELTQSLVADGIKWVEDMDKYRDHLWSEVRTQCEKQCHDGLESCPVLLRLGELHNSSCCTPRAPPKALDTNKATPAEGFEWIEKTEKYRTGLWYDLIIGECTKRCREGLKSCSIMEELKKMRDKTALQTDSMIFTTPLHNSSHQISLVAMKSDDSTCPGA